MNLIMTKGLPASGKSTWAKEWVKDHPDHKRVNKDDLRAMIDAGQWSKKNEQFILNVRDGIIAAALDSGCSVIVDDTNFAKQHEVRLMELAKAFNADFSIKDFSDVPLETCLERDRKRGDKAVGDKNIKRMWRQFLKPTLPTIKWDENLRQAIICDIDGTLALFGDANPYDRDFSKDKLNVNVLHVLRMQEAAATAVTSGEAEILLVSGRMEKNRKVTEEWLRNFGIHYDALYMRPTDDTRSDIIIKQEIYENKIKGKYNVRLVLDDRNRVVAMWRSLGLTCLQVADGDF